MQFSYFTVCKAIAIDNYEKQYDTDISFKKGDIIDITEKGDSDWWIGQLGDVSGHVPRRYVKEDKGELKIIVNESPLGAFTHRQ